MNLTKSAPQVSEITKPEPIDFDNELKSKETSQLKLIKSDLEAICDGFDPFNPHDCPDAIAKLIKKHHLNVFQDDPFTFTNHLLRLLTATEAVLKQKP